MDNTILNISEKLVAAVETAMNPNVHHVQRAEAYQLCENFKENSPECAQCGLQLAAKTNSPIIRHFGLQLLEHCIKYRWNSLSQSDKLYIKNTAMNLLAQGTHPILVEQAHVKDALSRLVVEMIKREWPQQWPDLLPELVELCKMGETQTELVLLILLRLAEDVVTFQNFQNQRRKEIYQALTSNMTELFKFMIELLTLHVRSYQKLKTSLNEEEKQKSLCHCKVSQAILMTLTGFVEWIAIDYIIADKGLLLEMFCLLLLDELLHLSSVECLLQIVNRKGKPAERRPILILFSENAMEVIFSAVRLASTKSLDENHYVFLKKLCQVLIGIGNQLCSLWGFLKEVSQPPKFAIYLDAILAFTQHPSQVLSSYTLPLWISFFRHEQISQDPLVLRILPEVLTSATSKLMKVGFPSRSDSSSCQYACLDFDSDEDFNSFFFKYRADVAATVRLATLLSPIVAFNFASQWLELQLQKVFNVEEGNENGFCNTSSEFYLKWDAMTVFFECVLSKIFTSDKQKPPTDDGIRLLKAVLNYNTQDPLILSCLLSCISALFIFLTLAPEILPSVLEKIFASMIFSIPGQTKATRNRSVKNVRRHACSSLVKICKQYPDLLLPKFEEIYNHVKVISTDPEQLSQMEKCTLMEALVLISNQFQDYVKQSAFIQELLAPVTQIWLGTDVEEALWSPEKFMSFIGLDKEPVEPSQDDVVGINRSQIILCVNTILGVIKRSKWPNDEDVAKNNGYVKEYLKDVPVFCNPATPYIKPLLDNLLALLRTLNALWLPEMLAKVSPQYAKAHDILDIDKMVALGINPPCGDISDIPVTRLPIDRMQSFLTSLHDNSYHILGNACITLGHEFFIHLSSIDFVNSSGLNNLDLIPDYRLRSVIRFFIKPLVQGCPPEFYESLLIPILGALCPHVYQRLSMKWHSINQRYETSVLNEDDSAESQEILEDQLTRQLTREYVDLIGTICQKKNFEVLFSDMIMDDEMDHSKPPCQPENLGDLGQLIMKNMFLCSSITLCLYSALFWNDATTCNKSIHICSLLLKQLINDQSISFEGANLVMLSIFHGLQQHGQHDANQSMLLTLGLQAYEALRPVYPEIINVMLKIPSCTEQAIKAFDEKLLQIRHNKQFPEKKKKDMFKNLVIEIIGKNIGQLFRKDTHIVNLKPLFKPPKAVTHSLDEVESHDMSLSSLFGSREK